MAEIGVYQQGINWSWEKLRSYWKCVDELGFDAGWMMDNVVYPDAVTDKMLNVWETWTVLSVLAEITENIRFGPLVTPCLRRNPCLLAKMASSIDQISNGRLELGIGTGDDPIYFEPWGQTYLPIKERIACLREEIEIIKKLWTEDSVDYQGTFYTLKEATNDPKPTQRPHPPVWVGLVMGRKVMPKVAAELADAVNVYNASDVAAEELLQLVQEHCENIGRAFDEIPTSRNVNVIFTDGKKTFDRHISGADGSLQHMIASDEERREDQRSTLDQQFARVKAASDKFEIYSRLTERHVVGSPQQVAEELCRIAEAGFDQVIVHGLDDTDALRLFAEQVMPVVKVATG